ncbi:MAG TPA: response regulator transcription factor [Puia sp.]|jgi:two-component system invasion response regulator UvrY|nr:response regulator transcription factor [Puia sp.]
MIKILLADDHFAIRQRLKQILLDEYPLSHIEEVADGNGLLEQALAEDWDLVIADISMPELSGLEALRHIRLSNPSLPVLLLSIYCDDDYASHVMKAGASAYLCKEAAHDELVSTVHRLIV